MLEYIDGRPTSFIQNLHEVAISIATGISLHQCERRSVEQIWSKISTKQFCRKYGLLVQCIVAPEKP